MTTNTQPILTDAETMEILIAFYQEALRFLGVPNELWAEVKMGTTIDSNGKASIINIDYEICDMPENRQVQMVGIFRKAYFDNLSVAGEYNGFVDKVLCLLASHNPLCNFCCNPDSCNSVYMCVDRCIY